MQQMPNYIQGPDQKWAREAWNEGKSQGLCDARCDRGKRVNKVGMLCKSGTYSDEMN